MFLIIRPGLIVLCTFSKLITLPGTTEFQGGPVIHTETCLAAVRIRIKPGHVTGTLTEGGSAGMSQVKTQ